MAQQAKVDKTPAAQAAETADPSKALAPKGFLRSMIDRYREWSEPGLREARILGAMQSYREGLDRFAKVASTTSGSTVESIDEKISGQISTLQDRSRAQYARVYSEFEENINAVLATTSLPTLSDFQNAQRADQKNALKQLDPADRAKVTTLLTQLRKGVAPHLQTIAKIREGYDKLLELAPSEGVQTRFQDVLKGELEKENIRITFGQTAIGDVVNTAFTQAEELQKLEGEIKSAQETGAKLLQQYRQTLDRINPDTEIKVLPGEETSLVKVPNELAQSLRTRLFEETKKSRLAAKEAAQALQDNPSQETLEAFIAARETFKEEFEKVQGVFKAVASQLQDLSQNYTTTAGSEDLDKAGNAFSKTCAGLCESGNLEAIQTLTNARAKLEAAYQTAITVVLESKPDITTDELTKILSPLGELKTQLLAVENEEDVTKVIEAITTATKKEKEEEDPPFLASVKASLNEAAKEKEEKKSE
jgi:hypothetical protein